MSLYPAGGFSSITLAYQAAERINYRAANKHAAVVIYIGDCDPAGVLIDVALERELRDHLDSEIHLLFRRLAITPEQIDQYELPTKPRKATDRRSRHVRETVEAEAMPAHVLRALLRKHVERLLPPHALAVTKAAETSERAYLFDLAHLAEHGR